MRRQRYSMMGAIAVGFAALALSACAGGQVGKPKPSGFLGDYSKLHPGAEGQAQLVYVDPQVQFSKYRKMMIDPVTIWRSAETSDVPHEEALDLIDDLEVALRITLDDDYEMVKVPGPDVLRLRVAITEAEGSWWVVDGRLGDAMDPDLKAVGAKPPSNATRSFVGEAGIEAEILDSSSGARLAAAIDRRAGKSSWKPEDNKWADVEKAFNYWANRLRDRLRELRKSS